jgi:hypothetical protein
MWFNRYMKGLTRFAGLLVCAGIWVVACTGESSQPGGTGGSGGGGVTVRTTEPCEVGATECVSDKVGRACPQGPEPGWVYFACDSTELCENGTCVPDEIQTPRPDLCVEGEKECVSAALARQCARGGDAWLPLACHSGTVCLGGDCVPVEAGAPLQICTAQAFECVGETMARVCFEGTSWAYFPCAGGCRAGTCSTIATDGGSNSPGPDADMLVDAAGSDASDGG